MYPVASRVRSIAFSKPMNFLSKYEQTTDPTVLPMAVPRVKKPKGTPSVRENKTAPNATPGQKRYPNNRIAAKAMPEGGQTRATVPDRKDECFPNSPPRK